MTDEQSQLESIDDLTALRRAHDPQLVLRFGYAPTTCFTNRRPVTAVIEPEPPGIGGPPR